MKKVAEHPLIMIASLAVAVIALIATLVLFFLSQSHQELVYAVNPVRTRVVTAEQARGIEIRYKGLELRDADVTIGQVAIWNSGDQSIRKENILKDIVIYTEPAVKLLEVKIVNANRALDVTNFSLIDPPELTERVCS